MSRLWLVDRIPRAYDQAAMQNVIRQLEQHANGVSEGSTVVLGTEKPSTSGTSIDFLNIPPWVKRVTLMLDGVSTNGVANPLIQIGDAGGVETTGYRSASFASTSDDISTSGFILNCRNPANVIDGALTLFLMDAANNTWVANGQFTLHAAGFGIGTSGMKSLSATLTRVRLTTSNGTDAYDAGAINIQYG